MFKRLIVAAVALSLVLTSATAGAIVVERVIAVVGERAIFLTDLRARARPFVETLNKRVPAGPQRAAAQSKLYSQLLERMIEEHLEQVAADRTNTRVTASEVDQTLAKIAASAGISTAKLFETVRAQEGMTQQEYRGEIRKQVLESKLLNRLMQNRMRITEQDLVAMFETVRKQERAVRLYRPSWLVIRLGEKPSATALNTARAKLMKARQRIKGGESFGDVAKSLSDDPATRDQGGDLGIRAPARSAPAQQGRKPALAAALEAIAMTLEPGEVSTPFRYRDAMAIMTITSRQPSRYVAIDAVRPEMMQRVRAQKLEKAKRKWLKQLRRGTFVDVRL